MSERLRRLSGRHPGPVEIRIDEREHAHMLVVTMNDVEYWLPSFKGAFNVGEAA